MTTESERKTRRERVDPRVRRAGWTSIVPFAAPLDSRWLTVTAVEEYETANGPADYALRSAGRILRVVEATKPMALLMSPPWIHEQQLINQENLVHARNSRE